MGVQARWLDWAVASLAMRPPQVVEQGTTGQEAPQPRQSVPHDALSQIHQLTTIPLPPRVLIRFCSRARDLEGRSEYVVSQFDR